MDVHEVLVAARAVQERRGYDWKEGHPDRPGPCCPGCSIAAVLGEANHVTAGTHPASLALAEQFTFERNLFVSPPDLSDRVLLESKERHREFTLAEVLERFDKAINATSPDPMDLDLSVPVEV